MDLHWNQHFHVEEKLRPSIYRKIVVWNRSQQEMIKLNTDKKFLEHIVTVGIGGMVKDNIGEFNLEFAISVWCKDHNIVEATTAKCVVQCLKNNGHQRGIIEIDSLLVVDVMKNRTSQNCNLKIIVDETADLVGNADFCFPRCYGEVNTMADHLAKLATMKN